MESPNLIRRIADIRSKLRKSEAKVADYVLAQASDVINMRIADLAANADVSEPTVIRFCRAIGFDGFQSFKLQLAQQLVMGSVYTQFAVDDSDTVTDLRNKVFDSTVGSLLTVRDELDPDVLEKAINTAEPLKCEPDSELSVMIDTLRKEITVSATKSVPSQWNTLSNDPDDKTVEK